MRMHQAKRANSCGKLLLQKWNILSLYSDIRFAMRQHAKGKTHALQIDLHKLQHAIAVVQNDISHSESYHADSVCTGKQPGLLLLLPVVT